VLCCALIIKENYKLLLVCFYSFRRIYLKEIKKIAWPCDIMHGESSELAERGDVG